jgi:hypothetical protein
VVGEVGGQKTLDAIRHLQTELSKRFGTEVETDSGRATLYISHDRVELADEEASVIGEHAMAAAVGLIPL